MGNWWRKSPAFLSCSLPFSPTGLVIRSPKTTPPLFFKIGQGFLLALSATCEAPLLPFFALGAISLFTFFVSAGMRPLFFPPEAGQLVPLFFCSLHRFFPFPCMVHQLFRDGDSPPSGMEKKRFRAMLGGLRTFLEPQRTPFFFLRYHPLFFSLFVP